MIFQPTNGPLDWRKFLAKPDLQWKPGFSAIETAYSWEQQKGLPPEINALFSDVELVFAIPEYKVGLPGGARDSQNDVFALLRDDVGLIPCMVEAKRDEPFGPTLAEWQKDASQGKKTRLRAICELLGLDAENLDETLRYQLFHRAASAVLTAQKFHTKRAAMIVQSFSPEHRWLEDYCAFTALFGCDSAINSLETTLLPGGIELWIGWASCQPQTENVDL